MMRIDVISAVPDLLISPINTSIIKRACERNKVEIIVHNLRDYAYDKHKQIDDKPFSGGAGMLLKPEPFFDCIELLLGERKYDYIIFPTPGGKLYEQKIANRYSLANNIMILAGHYKGVDDRVRAKFATDEISIGNYILTGGEIASIVIIDSIVRLIPGVLNDSESALNDSLMDGDIIEPPFYTRPAIFRDMKVPDVLLSGNEKKVKEWKEQQSIVLTEKWKKLNSME